MRLILIIFCISIVLSPSSFAQNIMEEQEIKLPDYILSTEETPLDTPKMQDSEYNFAESFEDELENLLKSEQELLPKYKFEAEIIVLNKNTNKLQSYSLNHKTTIIHKPLEINVLNCLQNYNSITNNDYIFLDIIDIKTQNFVYNGWMSRRLPGLAPFNHPVYTIKVKNCKVSNELIIEDIKETKERASIYYDKENENNSNTQKIPKVFPTY